MTTQNTSHQLTNELPNEMHSVSRFSTVNLAATDQSGSQLQVTDQSGSALQVTDQSGSALQVTDQSGSAGFRRHVDIQP